MNSILYVFIEFYFVCRHQLDNILYLIIIFHEINYFPVTKDNSKYC